MPGRPASRWWSSAECSSSLFLSFLALYLVKKTSSQNAEPERRDDLHGHLWSAGAHGDGLLRLLVSEGSETKLGFKLGSWSCLNLLFGILGGNAHLRMQKGCFVNSRPSRGSCRTLSSFDTLGVSNLSSQPCWVPGSPPRTERMTSVCSSRGQTWPTVETNETLSDHQSARCCASLMLLRIIYWEPEIRPSWSRLSTSF